MEASVLTAAPQIQIAGVTIAYEKPLKGGTFVALSGIHLDIDHGTFVTIVGPSGCGKSSLLLAIAGLIQPAAGNVLVNGRSVTGPGRDRAMVFQDFALLPWRTVLENVRFSLELHRWTGSAVDVDPDAVDGPTPSQDMAAFHFAHRIAELEARVVRAGFAPRSGDDAVPDHSGQW